MHALRQVVCVWNICVGPWYLSLIIGKRSYSKALNKFPYCLTRKKNLFIFPPRGRDSSTAYKISDFVYPTPFYSSIFWYKSRSVNNHKHNIPGHKPPHLQYSEPNVKNLLSWPTLSIQHFSTHPIRTRQFTRIAQIARLSAPSSSCSVRSVRVAKTILPKFYIGVESPSVYQGSSNLTTNFNICNIDWLNDRKCCTSALSFSVEMVTIA